MSHEKKDPAKEPVQPLFEPAFKDMEDYDPMNIGGPGGQTINTEHNEKGILESGLSRVIARDTRAALGKDRSFRQGIYTTNHEGA